MPIKVNIYNQKAEQVGDMKLTDKVFGVKTNTDLLHQAMVAQMGNERQVLAHTKDRSEVRGGGKKPWKQKGTGRARAGSTRSPIWKGGGVTFGPTKERIFSKNINKKMKQKAMLMVLSNKVKNENFVIIDKLEMKEFKTKAFDKILKHLEEKILTDKKEASKNNRKRSVLIINKKDDKIKYSGRNIAGVEIINSDNINILDLLKYRNLILTVDGVKKLEERYDK